MKIESENRAHNQREKTVPKYDANLAKNIVNTLDKSLDAIDDLSFLRLQKSRTEALSYHVRLKRHWLSMGIAASIIMFVAVPMWWQENDTMNIENADTDIVSPDVPFAPQELDDMDMLIAMDDTDA